MNTRLGIALFMAVALGSGAVRADIQVDFNDRGNTVISPTLDGWEGFALGAAGSGLVDVTGPVTRTYGGIDITLSRIVVGGTPLLHDINSDPGPPNAGSFTQANLMRDGVHVKSSATGEGLNILIEGLTPNAQYDGRIWSYDSAHANNSSIWANFDSDWYANGVQFANDISLAGPLPTNNTDYSYGFSAVANANGELVIQGLRDSASTGNPVLINGLQLTLVPEPASAMLIGLGAACLLTRRSRS